MDDRKVKGTMVLHFVKIIRKFKDLEWNKYLKPEDWEIINRIVLPVKWYPLDFFKRCSIAVFHLLGRGDLEAARANGQMLAKQLFSTTYRSLGALDDPMRALNQFVQMYASFFNFSSLRLEKAGLKSALLFHNYDPRDKDNIPYSKLLQGMYEEMIQMTGGKNVRVAITARQWEGDPETKWEISWD
jgi:uncharacterized protein (TIGR02265 family)